MSNKINLGMKVYDFNHGILTEYLPLENFKTNLLISGGSRSERTELLSHVLNQFYARLPDMGVLLIQLESNEDISHTKHRTIIKLSVPLLGLRTVII